MKKYLKKASLYCFTPDKLAKGRDIIDIVIRQVRGGCDIIQLREKNISKREKLHLAFEIRKITREKNVIFIVNDDVDIALLSGADGVHLGQNDIPVKYARELLKDKIIGLSSGNLEEYKKAQEEDVDYVAMGPVFSTATKDDAGPAVGMAELSDILKYKKKLTAVIGGIDLNNIEQFSGLKIDMFAVIRDIINADSIEERIMEIKERIKTINN